VLPFELREQVVLNTAWGFISGCPPAHNDIVGVLKLPDESTAPMPYRLAGSKIQILPKSRTKSWRSPQFSSFADVDNAALGHPGFPQFADLNCGILPFEVPSHTPIQEDWGVSRFTEEHVHSRVPRGVFQGRRPKLSNRQEAFKTEFLKKLTITQCLHHFAPDGTRNPRDGRARVVPASHGRSPAGPPGASYGLAELCVVSHQKRCWPYCSPLLDPANGMRISCGLDWCDPGLRGRGAARIPTNTPGS